MFNDDFKNIVNFWKIIINHEWLYIKDKEESIYTYINEKWFSKEKEPWNPDKWITKPLIKDDWFIIYNKIKEYILEQYKNNNNSYKLMFWSKNKKINISDIIWEDIELITLSEKYIKETLWKEQFNHIISNISSKIPNSLLIKILNQPNGYGDIKLYISANSKLIDIKDEDWNSIEYYSDILITSWYFYWYFLDTKTNKTKSFFNDSDIIPIIQQLADDNILSIKNDMVSKQTYIFIWNSKIPIDKNSNIKYIQEMKNNYYVWNNIIENHFRISWYGVNIDIIPTNLDKLLNKKQLVTLLEVFNEAILRYNKWENNKDVKKNQLLHSEFNLFFLLYNIYNHFIQEKETELSILNAIPFSFIFRNKKDGSVIESINWITLSKINSIINTFKINLTKYEKYKNIKTEDVIKMINGLLFQNVVFSNYLAEDWYKPKNDFLLKIQFIKSLLLNDKSKIYSLLKWIPKFIIKEKRKHFNWTSLSKWYYANWHTYNNIKYLLWEKDITDKNDRQIKDDELYIKNKHIIFIIKDVLKVNPNFIEQFIIQLKHYNKQTIHKFLFSRLIHYTSINTDIRLKGRTTILNKLIDNIELIDILYILQYYIPSSSDKVDNFYWRIYNPDKKFLFSHFINMRMTKDNINNVIFDFISKIYINMPNKRWLLKNIIQYFYRHIENLDDIEIYILQTLIK